MSDIMNELLSYIQEHKITSTHSHHFEDAYFQNFNLDTLLAHSYIDWSGVPVGTTALEKTDYLEKVRYKSYFIWLQKSLQELYGLEGPLTADNWNGLSKRIEDSHKDKQFHIRLLKQKCRYEKIILDTYWNPGSNNGYPEIFSPAFRVDPLFFGYSSEGCDHNGLGPNDLYGFRAKEIDEYIASVKELIVQKKQQGCIALKCGIAYDRDLHFRETSKEDAARVLKCSNEQRTDQDITSFQDYLFYRICEIAAEQQLPLQCHTGLGQLKGTNAMEMKEVIEKNPETKFVLFHCSFPWIYDICALLHNYKNVYPDLCWLPLLSQTAAQTMLHQLIEIGTSDKVCWGCDTWTSEESYGALLAFRQVLANVLESKVKEGYFSLNDAKTIADRIMYDNAKELYF